MRAFVQALFLCPLFVGAQWSYIPVVLPTATQLPSNWEMGSGLMSGNGSGFWSQSQYYSPSSGSGFRAHFTSNDWSATEVALSGGGGPGCCSIAIVGSVEGRGVQYLRSDMGYRTAHALLFDGSAFEHRNFHWVPGLLDLLEPIADTVGVASSNIGLEQFLSWITPNSLRTDTVEFGGLVTGLAFHDADTGACIVSWGDAVRSIWVTLNGGQDWEQVLVDSLHALRDAEWLDAQTLLLVGNTGYVARSWNSGDDWEQVAFPDTNDLYSVSGYSADSVWVSGAGGTIRATGDAGMVWHDRHLGDSLVWKIQTFEDAIYAYEQFQGQFGIKYTKLNKYQPFPVPSGSGPGLWQLTFNGVVLPWLEEGTETQVRVYDRIGRKVMAQFEASTVRMEHLASGLYLVHWKTDAASGVLKVAWVRPD